MHPAFVVVVLGLAVFAASAQDSRNAPPGEGAASAPASRRPRRGSTPADDESAYVRIVGRGAARRLETGYASFFDADGREVILVGAVHVADADYYAELNGLLGACGFVLYEGVSGAPTEDMTTIARLQLSLGRLLDLTFQKDGVVYGRPHFVHADLDARTIEAKLAERGETLLPGGDALRAFGPFLSRLLEAAADAAERARRSGTPGAFDMVKPRVAEALTDPRTRDARSRAWDDVVIGARNERAAEVLDVALAEGARSVAIFYGAAHLADLERRLATRGFSKRGPMRWLTAWRLGRNAPPPVVEARTPAGDAL
ncbi:MAG TPA: hypothetical protein VEI02_16970 [Planctomycetota bacterium]|nr:hypothetical protein [Planctomycetota bacterium]